MQRVVLAGTGTGVGKTYVTRRLRQALELHLRVVALKPIESGYDAPNSDARAIGGAMWSEPLYHFEPALSPHRVARQAGVTCDVARIVAWVEERGRARGAELALIETAGGLFTPIDDEGRTNADLITALSPCQWLLVAANRLGVLHDVGAVLRASRATFPPTAVLLSRPCPDESSTSNVEELSRLLGSRGFEFQLPGVGPRVVDVEQGSALEDLARELAERASHT